MGAVAALPLRRIVTSRWREPFFLTWSLALIANIVAAAMLDGGVESPLVWMLVLPQPTTTAAPMAIVEPSG